MFEMGDCRAHSTGLVATIRGSIASSRKRQSWQRSRASGGVVNHETQQHAPEEIQGMILLSRYWRPIKGVRDMKYITVYAVPASARASPYNQPSHPAGTTSLPHKGQSAESKTNNIAVPLSIQIFRDPCMAAESSYPPAEGPAEWNETVVPQTREDVLNEDSLPLHYAAKWVFAIATTDISKT